MSHAPVCQPVYFLPGICFIVVWNQSHHCCIVCKFDHCVLGIIGNAVKSVQWIQHGTPLWHPSAEGQSVNVSVHNWAHCMNCVYLSYTFEEPFFSWSDVFLSNISSIFRPSSYYLICLLAFMLRFQWFPVVGNLMLALPSLCGIPFRQAADSAECHRYIWWNPTQCF